MKKNVVLSVEREVPLLLFLWKWKVSTPAALTKKFFRSCSPKTAYNRLLSLRHAGLIQMRSDGFGQKFCCALDKKGFEAIREYLPLLKEEGYKSERVGHDLLLAAFHLGDWFIDTPKTATLFSEQQLRRLDPTAYPEWIPQSEQHRPDGYTRTFFGDKAVTFAIEVELTHKRIDDYVNVAKFYGLFKNITRVLWLVPRPSMAATLQEHMVQRGRSEHNPHNFIVLDDFLKNGWGACIECGPDEGKPLLTVLTGQVPDKHRQSAGQLPFLALLDTRKSPHTSDVYRNYEFGDFRD